MSILIENPFPLFTDTDGDSLENGNIYIGEPGLNPIVNPLTVYWDALLTVPAVQPIKTKGGYPVHSGSPGKLYCSTNYSILVQNKNGTLVYANTLIDFFNDPIGDTIHRVNNIATLRTLRSFTTGFAVQVLGYYAPGDEGGGPVRYWDSLSVAADNGGSIIRPTSIAIGDPGRWVFACGLEFNVRWFGAKGDNATDDTLTFQAALYAARTLFVPAGEYLIYQDLIIKANTVLYGEGDQSIITTKNALKKNVLITEPDAANIYIHDLYLAGSAHGSQPANNVAPIVDDSGCGIVLIGATNAVIERVAIRNCGGDGTTANTNGVAGIWLTYGSRDCLISRCTVTLCRNGLNEDDFFFKTCLDNSFKGNTVLDCRFGIATEVPNGRGTKISGNTIKRCAYGAIDINRSSYVLVSDNVIEACGLTGVPATFAPAITVYGSDLTRVNDVIISGNTFLDNYTTAVKITQQCYHCKVIGNNISGGINGGGVLVQGSRYIDVIANNILGCVGWGVYMNNILVGAIDIAVDGCVVSDNNIDACTQGGIYLQKSARMVVKGNKITGGGTESPNTYSGIAFTSATVDGVINGNVVFGTAYKYGIAGLDGGSINNVVSDNRVSGPPATATYGFAGANYTDNNF